MDSDGRLIPVLIVANGTLQILLCTFRNVDGTLCCVKSVFGSNPPEWGYSGSGMSYLLLGLDV